MNAAPLTAAINFCSNDYRFIRACVEALRPISSSMLVTVCDHFFDGSVENYALLEEVYLAFPEVTFIEFAFDHQCSYRKFTPLYPEHPDWRHEWHNTGRWIAYHFLPKECEHVLFLDCDEIIDPARFAQWLTLGAYADYAAVRFAAHWYFRSAHFQSIQHADTILMLRKEAISPHHLWDENEREGLFHHTNGKKALQVLGVDENPLVHHYSFVRAPMEMRRKLQTWGHHWERDWEQLLEQELAHPFAGQDFIRRYSYREVIPWLDPLQVEIPKLEPISYDEHLTRLHSFPNVIRVDKNQMWKRELDAYTGLQ